MKTRKIKLVTLALLLASGVTFAQKKEIRNVQDALEDQNLAEAQSIFKTIDYSQVPSLNDKYQSRYYAERGIITVFSIKKSGNIDVDKLVAAHKDLNKALEIGGLKDDEVKMANKVKQTIEKTLVNSSLKLRKKEQFSEASHYLHAAYTLSPNDTIYLYAAANNAYNAQEFDKAIGYYKTLKDIGYTGKSLQYVAVNKTTGELQAFSNKNQRDIMMKTGQYKDPSVKRTPSKAGDIVKQLAILYIKKGNNEKAMTALKEARKSNPDDIEIIRATAIVYQKLGKTEEYTQLIKGLIKKDPQKAGLYYKILADEALINNHKPELAKKYYKKAIKANPEMGDAYYGVASAILQKQKEIVDEMNTLGMSDTDTKKYNELAEKRRVLLEKALPYIEKAVNYSPDNINAIRTLYQLNVQLGNKEEAAKYKKLLEKKS